ncbi:DUF6600 domain-containing protein [Fibrisoma limi]|nr:DUF6600 domain-containing protein [Fibrisoma limi]
MKTVGKFWIGLVGVTLGLISATTTMAQSGYDPWGYNEPSYNQPGYGQPYGQPGDFYDALSPHGQWVQTPEYGTVWIPNVEAGFQPYGTNGHWVVTEFGNTWVSDYDWGWAPFHYGRWYFDRYRGWAWVPGTEWGPAWVSWRSGGGYYGWAPLGPGVNINVNINIPPNYWVFVPQAYITSPRLYNYCVPRPRVVNIYQNTTIINNVYRVNNRAYAYGPRREEIEYVTRRSVPVYRIDNLDRPGRAVYRQNSVGIYRPDVNAGWRGNTNRGPGDQRDYSRRDNIPTPNTYGNDNRVNRDWRTDERANQPRNQSRGEREWSQRQTPRYEPQPSQPVPQQPQTYPQPQRPERSESNPAGWSRGGRQQSAPQGGYNQPREQRTDRFERGGNQPQPEQQQGPAYQGRGGSRGPR